MWLKRPPSSGADAKPSPWPAVTGSSIRSVIFAASIMAFPPTIGQLLNTPAAIVVYLLASTVVAAVTGLATRADHQRAERVPRYRREREAAGRDVPPDVQVVLDACAASPRQSDRKGS